MPLPRLNEKKLKKCSERQTVGKWPLPCLNRRLMAAHVVEANIAYAPRSHDDPAQPGVHHMQLRDEVLDARVLEQLHLRPGRFGGAAFSGRPVSGVWAT